MVERLLPSDDPVAEEVLEWTIKRDAEDITQLMEWLAETSARKDRELLINRALDLMEEINHLGAFGRVEVEDAVSVAGGREVLANGMRQGIDRDRWVRNDRESGNLARYCQPRADKDCSRATRKR